MKGGISHWIIGSSWRDSSIFVSSDDNISVEKCLSRRHPKPLDSTERLVPELKTRYLSLHFH